MVKIMIKGGVWKNTEDEILKAAVMKYGKNQWARISSLLVRKSAKQCKARWFEWLDPSIKKTEWSREEEERLLHLAKLMPTQWRTIAPIVGRTAAQCLEHYNRLLDQAQEKEAGGALGVDDPRKLRSGEIEPAPETKPAKPDSVDMDEDEKEMLNEARARLANTKGKKAKRKAREKQLEEARRLSALQKRRELKAAGIELQIRKKKLKGIDYNKEIPFQRVQPAGFFDVSQERARESEELSTADLVGNTLERLEGKRRMDIEERERRDDQKRQRLKDLKNTPQAIMQINKANEVDFNMVKKRGKLNLPQPQVSDRELEEIAKMEAGQGDTEDNEKEGVTRSLLSNYAPTPINNTGGATPAIFGNTSSSTSTRTPFRAPIARTPARIDTVRMEAQNILALNENFETPLKGGENTPLHPSDFSGLTPRPSTVQTPNVFATPLRTPAIGGGSATPMRASIQESPSAVSAREKKLLQSEISASLASLPLPKNEYSLSVPDAVVEDVKEDEIVPDAKDLEEQEQREIELREQERLKERSTVLRRNLPRPKPKSKAKPPVKSYLDESSPIEKLVEDLIQQEMEAIIYHDNICFPSDTNTPTLTTIQEGFLTTYEKFTDVELESAAELLDSEIDVVENEIKAQFKEDEYDLATEEAFSHTHNDLVFLLSDNKWISSSRANKAQKNASLTHHFELLHDTMKKQSQKASKIEKKLQVIHGGYINRSNTLMTQISEKYENILQLKIELASFEALRAREVDGVARRKEKIEREVGELVQKENRLQLRYANLLNEKEIVKSKIEEAKHENS